MTADRESKLTSDCVSRKDLANFLAGTLTSDQSMQILAHMEQCARCGSELESLETLPDPLTVPIRRSMETEDAGPEREPECSKALTQTWQAVRGSSTQSRQEIAHRIPFDQIGPYRLDHILGAGGMGTVYSAVHIGLDKPVALKILPLHRLHSTRAIERFRREARAVGRLNHPRIVAGYDAGIWEGVPYLAMERVTGTDLARLVHRWGPLGVADACELVRQAAEGLVYAHRADMVHRDIKPANLMLTPSGEVKILDFGLAVLKRLPADALTDSGQFLGTLDYMAPEQVVRHQKIDGRTDIYGLGATLFHLLTGRPPFAEGDEQTWIEKGRAIESVPAPSIHHLRPDVPQALSEFIATMLAKSAQDRPKDAAQVVEALEPFIASSDLPQLWNTVRAELEAETYGGSLSDANPTFSPAGVTQEPRKEQRLLSRRRYFRTAMILGGIGLLTATVFRLNDSQDAVVPRHASSHNERSGEIDPETMDWKPGPEGAGLPGLIPRPTVFPGLGRWQLTTRLPYASIRSFALSPEGERIACLGPTGLIRVYQIGEGEPELLQVYPGERPDAATALAWSPDGEWLVSGNGSGGIQLYLVEEGGPGRHFGTRRLGVLSLSWEPNSRRFVSSHENGTVCIWNLVGELQAELPKHGNQVFATSWSPDGRWIASGDADGRVRIWEVGQKTSKVLAEESSPIVRIAWDHSSARLAYLLGENTIKIVGVDGKEFPALVQTPEGQLKSLAWSPDGEHLAAGGLKIWIWNLGELATPQPIVPVPGEYLVDGLAWSSNGERLVWASPDDVWIRHEATGQSRQLFSIAKHRVYAVSWSPDGTRFVTAEGEGRLRFWNRDGSVKRMIQAHTSYIGDVAWSPDGRFVATTPGWGRHPLRAVRVWNAETGAVAGMLQGHESGVLCAVWSPDSRYLATGSGDLSIRLWNVGEGTAGPVLRGHEQNVESLSWSRDGRFLASGARDRTIRLWEMSSDVLSGKLPPPSPHIVSVKEPVLSLAWNPQGDRIAYSGVKKTVTLLEAFSGREFWSIPADYRPALLDWHPAGEHIACGHIGIVHSETGVRIPSLLRKWAVAYSPDGSYLAATGHYRTLTVYDSSARKPEPLWLALILDEETAAVFSAAGQLLNSSPAMDDEFLYVVEKESGRLEILSPQEFRARLAPSDQENTRVRQTAVR